jgi:hypothetical protein
VTDSTSTAAVSCAPTTVVRREERRIRRDIAALRSLSRRPGTAAVKAAISNGTDRFLIDLGTSHIPLARQNRLIDFAAAAVVAECPQCFQALEAARPIPALAHGSHC